MYKILLQKTAFLVVLLIAININTYSQQCGSIISSGPSALGNPAILDPDGDGDIVGDNTVSTFSSNTSELLEFEELTGSVDCPECEFDWTSLPSVVDEPDSDVNTGGNCGNTDVVSDNNGGEDHAYFTVFENASPESASCSFNDIYIAFRVRISNESSGNFAFSILLSNDGALVGEPVLNPDGTVLMNGGNPVIEGYQCCGAGKAMNVGFEKEILLQTGGSNAAKGVYIYNIDNRNGGGSAADQESFFNQSVSAQVSSACGTDPQCPNNTVPTFYTFTMPLSSLGFTSCAHFQSQFAAAAVSGSSGNSIIHQCNSTSDIGGVADNDPDPCTNLPCEFNNSCPSDCNIASGQNLLCAANVDFQLPVEFVDFSATLDLNQVKLDWSTASEVDNVGFEIERSSDGRSWDQLNFIAGQGYSDVFQEYTYNDLNPREGVNYYRLKQIDFDGSFNYSKIQSVTYSSKENKLLRIFPNPSSGLFSVSLSNPNKERAFVKLLDSTGSLIWEHRFNNQEAELYWEKEFDLPQHEVYFVVTQVGNKTETQKVVIVDRK